MLTEAECKNAICPSEKNKPGLLIPAVCTCKSARQDQNDGF